MGEEVRLDVTIRKQSMVTPAEATPQRILRNSNLDLVALRSHTRSVYFYSRNEDGSEDFFRHEKLAEALAKTLVPFYPMAGRLQQLVEGGRIDINCNAEGVLLVEAHTNAIVADFGAFAPNPRLVQLKPQVDYSQDISSFPLLVLQVTYFECGGVSLGVGMHHIVADGMSAIHFMNTWSEIARGKSLQVPPFIDRTLLEANSPPAPKFPHIEYQDPPILLKREIANDHGSDTAAYQSNGVNHETHIEIGIDNSDFFDSNGNGNGQQENKRLDLPNDFHNGNEENIHTAVRVFRFTRKQLDDIKQMAAVGASTDVAFSSYEVLAGHVWKSVTQARNLQPCQETKVSIATDGRSRLIPPLPKGYFGNVIFHCTPVALAGDLVTNPVSYAARRIHDALARMNNEYMRSAVDYLEEQEDVGKLIVGARHYNCPNLGILNWTRMPVYECDFGWGKPIFMGPCNITDDGLSFLLASAAHDGSVSLSLALRADHMATFAHLVTDI